MTKKIKRLLFCNRCEEEQLHLYLDAEMLKLRDNLLGNYLDFENPPLYGCLTCGFIVAIIEPKTKVGGNCE